MMTSQRGTIGHRTATLTLFSLQVLCLAGCMYSVSRSSDSIMPGAPTWPQYAAVASLLLAICALPAIGLAFAFMVPRFRPARRIFFYNALVCLLLLLALALPNLGLAG